MPDVARAIRVLENELECCKRPCARDECGKCDLVMDADWLAGGLADAIELLKEQEAVEPNHDPLSPTNRFCGKCGKRISRFHDHCPYCGRSVKYDA